MCQPEIGLLADGRAKLMGVIFESVLLLDCDIGKRGSLGGVPQSDDFICVGKLEMPDVNVHRASA
jgi:hypothetical protein